MPDTFDIPGVVHDPRVGLLPPFSLITAGSVYENDGLLSADGAAPDPVLEAETAGGPFGPVTFDKDTGHFSLSVPSGFFGTASFTYRARDRDGWSNGAAVRLNIGAGGGYDSWRHRLFGAGPADAAGLPGSDGDGDGVANLLEYVFGTNPLAADPGAPLELSWTGGAWMLTITAKTGCGQDIFLGVESSPPLEAASWKTLASINDYYPELTRTAPGVIKTEEHSPAGVWKCWLLLPANAKAGGFFRLRVSPDPPGISP
ncbi:MAG: hypothetical protein JWM59_4089 [Verrucomicrobiales bacterium]|nr:hypothetical protein [Verrucomicrobiales bacterium]